MSACRLIEAEKASHSVPRLCRMLGVSRSGYYAWRRRPPSERTLFDAVLLEKIETIHTNSRATYGAPRVHAELRALGISCGRKRVARLMRQAKLRGSLRGRRMRTTYRIALQQAAPDLLERNFAAGEPDRLWVADITYVRSKEGFLYLAFILDGCSRRVVGWSMATHLKSELVVDALQMAIARRKPAPGLVHHSDRGVQYTSLSFGKRLEDEGLLPSIDGTGGLRLRQRPGRELPGHLEDGASLPQHLAHQASGQDGDLRVHRGLLQHEAQALRARIPEPRRVRGG
jgi:putative transposase